MANSKFLVNIDLAHNELLNARIQVLSSAPVSPKEGWIYFDSTKKEFGYYNGTAWVYGTTVAEATSSVLGTIKLAGDLAGGTGAAPQVTNLHLAADTAISHKLTELSSPTAAKDAANKEYVDSKANGLSWKAPVQLATAAALPAYTQSGSGATGTLEANANGTLTIDGKEPSVGYRILVKNAVEAKHIGIYELTVKGEAGAKWKMVRTADANTGTQLEDATVRIREGTEEKNKAYNVNNEAAITIDTTAITIVEFENGLAVVGDGTYTERSANKIELKPITTTPTVPAAGEVSAVTKGASRKAVAAISGNNTLTEFTITHNLNTRLLRVQAQENSAGTPAAPVEIGWEPTSANAIKVSFAIKPANEEAFFVTIYG